MPISLARSPTSPCMNTSSTLWRELCRRATPSRACFNNPWGGWTRTGTGFVIRAHTRTRFTVWAFIRNLRLSEPAANDAGNCATHRVVNVLTDNYLSDVWHCIRTVDESSITRNATYRRWET